MPNDDFYANLDDYINEASQNTDRKLASYISSITTFRDEDILALFPDTKQLENLADLIDIVSKETDHNLKVGAFMDNAENFASVALTLIGSLTSKNLGG